VPSFPKSKKLGFFTRRKNQTREQRRNGPRSAGGRTKGKNRVAKKMLGRFVFGQEVQNRGKRNEGSDSDTAQDGGLLNRHIFDGGVCEES